MGAIVIISELKPPDRNHASSRFFRLLAFLFQFAAKPKPLSIASAEVSFEL